MLYKTKFERAEWVNSIGITSDNENAPPIAFLKDYQGLFKEQQFILSRALLYLQLPVRTRQQLLLSACERFCCFHITFGNSSID